ncbi:MAG: histidine--tRNA ligase [Psittacicella sp.]
MKIQSIRGMKDVLPAEVKNWNFIENIFQEVLSSFNYKEIRFPILEKTELFTRAVGEGTDVVTKEMYDFIDKSNEHITLRPEGTSSCVRALIENNLYYNSTQKLWYLGPMFRYERPQKGRLRQFHQLGIETFGVESYIADAEIITICYEIFKKLDILDHLNLELNSLGDKEERANHKKALVSYFNEHFNELDEDSKKRLSMNPLRILDSKNQDMTDLLKNAPKILDYLEPASKERFEKLCLLLDDLKISYTINTRLVRGLDYYTHTVFEWTTQALGSQGTVCGGGRYDNLIEMFIGKKVPGIGFGMGIERLLLLLETLDKLPKEINKVSAFTYESPEDLNKAFNAMQKVKNCFNLNIELDFSQSKLQKQHQRALKNNINSIFTLNSDGTLTHWNTKTNDKLTLDLNNLEKSSQEFIAI